MQDLIEKAARPLMKAKYAIALTGAGISTESGIPDFRGPSGVWTKDPDAERRAYQSYGRFQSNPGQYWEERMTNPSVLGDLHKVKPNPGHYALAELEKLGILKWVITQNVDNLHERAGNEHVLDYHGNAFKLRCPACAARYFTDEYDLAQLREEGRLPPLLQQRRYWVWHEFYSLPSIWRRVGMVRRNLRELWTVNLYYRDFLRKKLKADR